MVARILAGRTLADFPQEVRTAKSQMLKLVQNGQVEEAYTLVQSLSPDLRAAVKPFFTHFTAGRTTEMATAHAVVEIVAALEKATREFCPPRLNWMVNG